MKSKHTFGPWLTEDETSVNEHGAIGIDISNSHGTTKNLATVWCFDKDDEEGNANARLIATAPELYDFCVKVFELSSQITMPTEADINELNLLSNELIGKVLK